MLLRHAHQQPEISQRTRLEKIYCSNVCKRNRQGSQSVENPVMENFFANIALSAIKSGFQVTPLHPRTKIAFLPGLKSSRDPKQIAVWAEQYPDSNIGCVAHADLGEPWPLDMDCPLLWKAIEKETGHKFPNVLM